MIVSVYIKDGNIHFYNENRQFSDIGGIVYELGRPLLDFVCYEHDRFDDAFAFYAEIFENEYAHIGAKEPAFISGLKESMTEFQKREIYVYFYMQMLMEFIYAFIDSPRTAIEQLEEKIPGAIDRLRWTIDFEWPKSSLFVQVRYADKEKRLYRAAKDVVELISEHLKQAHRALLTEIELLIHIREKVDIPINSPMEYLYMLEVYHQEYGGRYIYLDNPFRTF